jgi:MoaD family protein
VAKQTTDKLIQVTHIGSWVQPGRVYPALKVRVLYFAIVRELANQREEILDVEEKTTVLDVLRVLARRHGEKFGEYIFDPGTGNPRSYLQFLVNENSILSLSGLSTMLTDNSVLAIIPPVGGG